MKNQLLSFKFLENKSLKESKRQVVDLTVIHPSVDQK